MSLEINILPGFGWTIGYNTVYGPGSVFQGLVKINITETQLNNADKLRIVFHASEQSHCSRSIRPSYHNQLFGSQKILWKKKDVQLLQLITANTDITIPFIIQLPMVQFPPSYNIASVKDGLAYNSEYRLSVYLDSKLEEEVIPLLTSSKKILYMPMIETSMSKVPIHITSLEPSSILLSHVSTSEEKPEIASPLATVRLISLDYVPGDEIPLSIKIKNISKKSIESIHVQLYQIQTWKKTTFTRTIGEQHLLNKIDQKILHLVPTNSCNTKEFEDIVFNTSLQVPSDCLPTFTYGPVFSITYQLKFSIKRRSKLWSQNWNLTDVTIRLGTLGYGIRSFEKMKAYSAYDSVFNHQSSIDEPISENRLPVPKFLDCLEYEESLPLYNKERLPDYCSAYTSCSANQSVEACIQ